MDIVWLHITQANHLRLYTDLTADHTAFIRRPYEVGYGTYLR